MKKELSSEAQGLLSSLNEDSLIDPDGWHYNIKAGGKSIHCTPQLKRHLVRETLLEINEYKPNFLSPQLKRDYNLMRLINIDDLIPSESELSSLYNKLKELSEDSQIKFDVEYLNKDQNYKIDNTIVSASMIDIADVIDFINGEELEVIYGRVVERRKKIDSIEQF